MPSTVLITGSGSGFGLLTAQALAKAGHVVYGGLRNAEELSAASKDGSIRHVIMDITKQESIDSAMSQILSETDGKLDCVIHNAGHMCTGPLESYSAEQLHDYFDVNTVGAHRLNQAVLPVMRKAGKGHIVWVSSSSAKHGSGPLLAPYFAAKAAMHSLAISLSTEVACFGIETTIVVPGIFPSGTNHFATAGKPAFPEIAAEYTVNGPLKDVEQVMMENTFKQWPKDATPQLVADAILGVVNAPRGSKPFRVHIDPFEDGGEEVMALADEKHEEFQRRCGILDMCKLRAE